MDIRLNEYISEIERLTSSIRHLNNEYEGRTRGHIYKQRLFQLEQRAKSIQDKIISVLRPGSVKQWLVTIEVKNRISQKYLTYPSTYDELDVLKIVKVLNAIGEEKFKVLDITLMGILKLGEFTDSPGFE